MTRLTDSGSSRSCSDVEPIRSAKTMVTTLRASALSFASALRLGSTRGARDVPQAPQKRWSAGLACPHAAHARASAVPHPPQKRFSAGFSRPQAVQVMTGETTDYSDEREGYP